MRFYFVLIFVLSLIFNYLSADINIRRCIRLYGKQLCKLRFARHRRHDLVKDDLSDNKVTKLVGDKCVNNKDCVGGAYCHFGRCRCFGSHIVISEHCWKKVGPDETGCTYDEQCEAVWPGAHCDYSICRCPEGQTTSPTREGPVCHYPGKCPTNGANALLYNRNSNMPAECFFFENDEMEKAGQFIGCDDYPEMYDCIRGICCPTRALACIQPMDPGQPKTSYAVLLTIQHPTLESEKRWFFNAITGSCNQFDYLGSEGNANNFLTKLHCETYCGERCPRGQPKLEKNDLKPMTCSASKDCDSDKYFCSKVSHLSLCCPSPEFICGEHGGVSSDSMLQQYSIGSNRFGRRPQTRWYWDKPSKRCKSFRYLGQGGNFNNFPNEQSCVDFCSRSLCLFGHPLISENGATANCSTDHHCPTTHFCMSTVCCPTATTVCNEPLSLGASCQAEPVPRYWFNANLKICQMFQFSGCHGNSNNFANSEDCQRFCDQIEDVPTCPHGEPLKVDAKQYWKCSPAADAAKSAENQNSCPANHECFFDGKLSSCCPKKEFTCRRPKDSGRKCNVGSSDRWYYDSNSRSCKLFDYFGCEGNSNNFDNQKVCEDYCRAYSCPFGGGIHKQDNGEPTLCQMDNSTKASICPKSHVCTPLLASGSSDLAQEMGHAYYCCPSRQTICLHQNIDEGLPCSEARMRYGYDIVLKTCIPFKYQGCAGNANNFQTHQSCTHFCSSASCAPGEIVFQSKNEDAFDCTKRPCPTGFMCVADVLDAKKSVCCGSANMGVCPLDHNAYIEERTKKPKTCNGEKANECPPGCACSFSRERRRYYCCTPKSDKKLECPLGLAPTENKDSHSKMGCNSDGQCPASSKCYWGGNKLQSGICCMQGSPCPPMFALDIERSQLGECSPLEPTSCSTNRHSICLFSETMDRFVCCKREPRQPTELSSCPGKMVRDAKKRLCSSHGDCPSNYSCIRRNYERTGICCRNKVIPQSALKRKQSLNQCQVHEDSCCSTSTNAADNASETCNPISCPSGYICIHEKFCCPNSFLIRSQIGQLCGDYWKPVMNETSRFPVLCSPAAGYCESGQACRFSAILRVHVCCRPLFALQSTNDLLLIT